MAGFGRRKSARLRPRVSRLVLALGIACIAVLVNPGTASAVGNNIQPIIDCKSVSGSTTTIVLGYTNSGAARSVATGTMNRISPSRLTSSLPTSFATGTQHGVRVFALNTNTEYMGGFWNVEGLVVNFYQAGQAAPTCTAAQMPADGNGSGTVIALGAAGLVGAAYIARSRRRLRKAGLTEDGAVHA